MSSLWSARYFHPKLGWLRDTWLISAGVEHWMVRPCALLLCMENILRALCSLSFLCCLIWVGHLQSHLVESSICYHCPSVAARLDQRICRIGLRETWSGNPEKWWYKPCFRVKIFPDIKQSIESRNRIIWGKDIQWSYFPKLLPFIVWGPLQE